MNQNEWFLVVFIVTIIVTIIFVALIKLLLYVRQVRRDAYKQGKDENIGRSMDMIHLMNYRIEEIDYEIMENPFLVVGIYKKYLLVELRRKDLYNSIGKYWVKFDNEKELEVVKEIPGYYKFNHRGDLFKVERE